MSKDENKINKEPENKLVTVAIHTYDKAVILKSILESEGIPSVIQGVNLIEPTVPGNVRVRINESDLKEALSVIERVDFTSQVESVDDLEKTKSRKVILIPVDFSDYTLKTCEFGFNLARDTGCEVKLMHAFFAPFYPTSIPFGDSFAVQTTDKDMYKEIKDRMEKEMKSLTDRINQKISNNELPNVNYSHILVEGLPEEEIISYSKKERPYAIVMGTRGGNAKSLDLIGSVTAEVIDGCKTPIFAIPENSKDQDISKMKRVVFLTNFREREFRTFDKVMQFIQNHSVKIHLVHMGKKDDVWNEIKLSGIQKYLKEQYPQLEVDYRLIDREEGVEVDLDKFVKENDIDMITMSSSRRGMFARIFNPGIARRMLFHSDTPLLVIKGL